MSVTPDPTDAKADGNFGSAGSHRTGYANDKLENAEYWARKGGTLNAGEGAVLCEEIDRLRERLAAIDTLHKQWAVKFLSGYGRSRGAQQIIDSLTEILHKKEDA